MRENKSPGVDGISPKIGLLKETVEQISTPIAHGFIMSLQEGTFCAFRMERSKHHSFIPKWFKKQILNYSPVSLTSVICKLLETIIRDHKMEFLIKH